ncbi:MAG: 50S ribosomal protein L6 [Candidatus Micrarchaeota archaeon]
MNGIKIPQGVTMSVEGPRITATGPKGSAERKFNPDIVGVTITGGEVQVTHMAKKLTRKANAAARAIEAHVKRLVQGVTEGYEKKLTVVYAHFPITVEAKDKVVTIKNFLGEKSLRTASIADGVKVRVEKQEITVTGSDNETVGQTAANIILATRISNRDRRVFQDGIYLVE